MDSTQLWYNYRRATSHPSPYFTPTPTSTYFDTTQRPLVSSSSSSPQYDFQSSEFDEEGFVLPPRSDPPSPTTLLNLCCPIPPSIAPLHPPLSSHSPFSFCSSSSSTPAVPLPPLQGFYPSSHKLSVSLLSPHTLLPNLIHAALTIRQKQTNGDHPSYYSPAFSVGADGNFHSQAATANMTGVTTSCMSTTTPPTPSTTALPDTPTLTQLPSSPPSTPPLSFSAHHQQQYHSPTDPNGSVPVDFSLPMASGPPPELHRSMQAMGPFSSPLPVCLLCGVIQDLCICLTCGAPFCCRCVGEVCCLCGSPHFSAPLSLPFGSHSLDEELSFDDMTAERSVERTGGRGREGGVMRVGKKLKSESSGGRGGRRRGGDGGGGDAGNNSGAWGRVTSGSVTFDKSQNRFMTQWKSRDGTKHSKSFYVKNYSSITEAKAKASQFRCLLLAGESSQALDECAAGGVGGRRRTAGGGALGGRKAAGKKSLGGGAGG
eukprot:GHVS01065136.1.p1 GENE.GHVS01065136.1~~GHVS01065136.1.p1  ORF type:complete len:486 (+),score=114.72 GHVS01065136.1:165-1622(+)